MQQTKRAAKPAGRGERHSAAWGKRLSLMLILATGMAFGQRWNNPTAGETGRFSSRIAPELSGLLAKAHQGSTHGQTVKVIVQYKQVPTSAHYATMQNRGGRLHVKLHSIKGAAFTIPVSALAALEADPEIASVTIDHPLKGMDDYTDAAMNASTAWNAGYDGSGIGVAVIDSGINDNHLDLWNSTQTSSRVVYHQDFTGTTAYNAYGHLVYDLYGHGTHVAGIIGGNGYRSGGRYAGVAPNVNLIDLRVLDGNGSGSDSMVIAAIQQAIALQNTYNIQVINLSLGRGISVGYAQDPLCQAVEAAWNSGIMVVVAAGNYGRISVSGSNGYGTVAAPGNDPLVLTVGAMKAMGTYSRTDDQIASYSSKGPTTYDHVVKPDLVAPGNMVVSLDAHASTLEGEFPGNEVAGNHTNHDYFILSGTSMATPAVAGGVALLLQQNPSLTPDQVKARLMKTAYKTFPTSSTATDTNTGQTFTSYYDLFTVGSGYMDLGAALTNTDLAPAAVGSALSPTAVYNSNGTVTLSNGNSSVAPSSVVWGTSVVWGSSVVWGANVSGSSVVWGTSVVWGSSITSGFSVVWGASSGTSATSVVWGASLLGTNGAFSGTDVEQ
jgi:serine protease AprX